MVSIPGEPKATLEDLMRWDALKREIARLTPTALILQEKELRAKIARDCFPNAKEGTNNLPLAQGWVLKFTNNIKRELDYGLYQALIEKFHAAGLNAAACLRQKWEIEKKNYNMLTAEEKQLFDQCLTIKPESPQLEIVLPAKAAKAQAAVASLAAAQATGTAPAGTGMPGVQL